MKLTVTNGIMVEVVAAIIMVLVEGETIASESEGGRRKVIPWTRVVVQLWVWGVSSCLHFRIPHCTLHQRAVEGQKRRSAIELVPGWVSFYFTFLFFEGLMFLPIWFFLRFT